MTPREKQFIYKAWEDKVVSDTSHMANAVNNAINNALRKKGQRAIPLWKKREKRLVGETAKNNLSLIQEIEAQEGKSWVDLVYQENRIRKKGGK